MSTATTNKQMNFSVSEMEALRTAMEFVIANRNNSQLLQNSEYREMADACERELTRRAAIASEERGE